MIELFFTMKVIERIVFWVILLASLAITSKEKIQGKLRSYRKLKESKNKLTPAYMVFNPTEKKIEIKCPHCKEKLKMDFGYVIKRPLPIGKIYQCPKCNEWFIIEDFEGEEQCTANTEK